jgi:hypothetical protein
MKRVILSAALMAGALGLAPAAKADEIFTTILPYGGYIQYDGKSPKDYGYLAGLYGSLGYSWSLVEIAGEYSNIEYKKAAPLPQGTGQQPQGGGGGGGGGKQATIGPKMKSAQQRTQTDTGALSPLRQLDATMIYTINNYSWIKARLGIHHIESSEVTSKGVDVFIAGLRIYQGFGWNLGVDTYSSEYQGQTQNVSVFQISPVLGFTLGNYFTYGSFYFQLTGHIINLNEDIGFYKTSFASGELSLTYNLGAGSLRIYGWGGQQVYAARADGFAVYNLPELHLAGLGAAVKYISGVHVSLEIAVSREVFQEPDNKEIMGAWIGLIKGGYTF